jgi:Flp pilus assembly protein TadG
MSRWARSERERGSATLEIAVLGPTLLLLVFTIVQASLWFYARSLALAAAQEGVAAGRAYGASVAVGVQHADDWIERNAGDSLLGSHVMASVANGTTVRIEVSGHSLSVLPGVPGMPVRQAAQGAVERFTVGVVP